jgi:shikimate dehydrogenase
LDDNAVYFAGRLVKMINDSSTRLVSLIGRSIGASRSPAIHENEAAALQFPLAYKIVDFDTLGWSNDDLGRAIDFLVQLGFCGSNITFPFKQSAAGLCTSLGLEAKMLGAVNTLRLSSNGIHGENTDWIGFAWTIEREFGSIVGESVAQIGAGGAGSATALALARSGVAEIALYDPELSRAEELCTRLAPHFETTRFIVCRDAESAIMGRNGIVNATPVGMAKIPGTPFEPSLMKSEQWLADIIYFPLETQLLKRARDNGQRCANGVSMVIGQAATAFDIFTGVAPDRERMFKRLQSDIEREASLKEIAA